MSALGCGFNGSVAAPRPPARLARLATFVEATPTVSFVPGADGLPTWGEIAASLKPRALAHLLRAGYRHVIYADADLWLLDAPTSLISALDEADILLTPHAVLPPGPRHALDLDQLLLNAGVFNSGLVALRNCSDAERFCAWWDERTATFRDRPFGKRSDQRWLNLVPYIFRSVKALTDPGVNVGHWRIAHADDVEHRDGRFFLRGHAISVMHLSGFVDAAERAGSLLGDSRLPGNARILTGGRKGLAVCDRPP